MQNNKKNLAFKIVVIVAFVCAVALTILYFVEQSNGNQSYFSYHFAIPIILFLVGIIAIILTRISLKSYSGESKGDNLMIVVGILLFVCSIFSLIMSYVNG